MKSITADERMAERRGAKLLIMGPTGIGKTSLLKTIPPAALDSVLLAEAESGDLCLQGLPLNMVRIETWEDARNLACRVGGPNPSFLPEMAYSQAHFNAIGGWWPELEKLKIIFIDSFTELSRLCFRYCE